jgi:oligopeptide transport system substrate-binding protein
MTKIILLCLLILASSCQKKESNTGLKIISYPLSSDIPTLDPAVAYDVVSAAVLYQIHDQLFEYDYHKIPVTLKPLLASSMPVVEKNGTRYTIKIKPNIKYHPHPLLTGRVVKAQDFITALKRLAFKGSNSGGFWLVDGIVEGLNAWREEVGTDIQKMLTTPISGAVALDDTTLQIDLTRPRPQFLYTLSMTFLSPTPEELIVPAQNNLREGTPGTGPFILKKWTTQSEVILDKNNYYNASVTPKIDRIHFKIIPEGTTQWLNFQKSKLDILPLPKDEFSNAIAASGELKPELINNNIKLMTGDSNTYWWFAFNMNHPILGKNKKVRLAIASAINRNEFIKLFTNNTGRLAGSLYPPGIFGFNENQKSPFNYDLNKAKEYLKQAGFADSAGLPEFVFDLRSNDTLGRQIGEFFQNEMKKIGIKVKIIPNTFAKFLEKLKQDQLQIFFDGWSLDYPDSENILTLLSSKNLPPGPNHSSFQNTEFDQLFSITETMENNEQKRKHLERMDALFQEELPWILLYYKRDYVLYHNHVKNFEPLATKLFNFFKYLDIDKH